MHPDHLRRARSRAGSTESVSCCLASSHPLLAQILTLRIHIALVHLFAANCEFTEEQHQLHAASGNARQFE
jgi:hypothetical protein